MIIIMHFVNISTVDIKAFMYVWSAHRRISAHFPRISDSSEISTNLLR